ncbi:hypothetical protein ACLK1X_09330 [Escherichia coli]
MSWFGNINVLTFLRDIGKHCSVNQMIDKEAVSGVSTVKIRGFRSLSFLDLLQGYDFACLNKQYGVVLQIGGSDQWGNITSGINLTGRLHQNQVFGLTVPLITEPMAPNYVNRRRAGWLIRRKPARTKSTSSGSTLRMPTFTAS